MVFAAISDWGRGIHRYRRRVSPPFFVTTPIYYTNDVPHIGSAYTTVVADVLARWRRLWGDDVVFLTGTDEHGLKVQRAAEERSLTPQQWVDETSERFRETWKLLDISNTDFIRTTEPRHRRSVQKFLQRVYDNGDIELDTYEGLYCVSCELYYTEADLVDGNCPIHGIPVDRVVEENYFFRLSRYEDRLLEHYTQHPGGVRARREAQRGARPHQAGPARLLDQPDVHLVGHPAAVGPEARHVRLVRRAGELLHCGWLRRRPRTLRPVLAGELPPHRQGHPASHAVYWPAMLMAAGEAPPRHVFAHGFLLVGGEKMSKTHANQIAPAELVADFGVDGYRYHFVADQRFGPDGDFSYEAMVARYNGDLANNFGNLASRVLNMATNYLGGTTPDPREDGPLVEASIAAFATFRESIDDALDFSGGFGAVWQLIKDANAYIEERQPWALHKAGDAGATAAVLGDCLEALRIVALLASPVIPTRRPSCGGGSGSKGRPRTSASPKRRLGGVSTLPATRSRRATRCSPASIGPSKMWVDSHCHLPAETGEADAVLERARAGGVEWMVCVGTDLETSRAAIALAERHEDVHATIGLHPHDASRLETEWPALVALAGHPRVVGIGEAGFDLHYNHSELDAQEAAFRARRSSCHTRPTARW